MPCGRCRQLLWEHGGPTCLVDVEGGARSLAELLPLAFGPDDLAGYAGATGAAGPGAVGPRAAGPGAPGAVPPRLREYVGTGTVFVHPDVAAGVQVWTAYWDRSDALTGGPGGVAGASAGPQRRGVLEEAPSWPAADQAVGWGLARTPSVVVVDAEGNLSWAGTQEPPASVPSRWGPG
jgi:cytidine deaminase